jgi:hypothetical protein
MVCNLRSVHKLNTLINLEILRSARHGHKLNGKLKRVTEQEDQR